MTVENLTGQVIKGYELQERIATGGFGTVYRALQAAFRREVAIKIILPEPARQPEFIRRFDSEARLVARLEHPHIIPLYDYWRNPDGAYLVMRYLRGGSLRQVLDTRTFSLAACSQILDQLASALDWAHRNDVIHRDIKPENILLDEDGNAYLGDFGIAKDIGTFGAEITDSNSLVGSLDYITPEQARGEPVTPQTDIYGLGVLLYEMIVGDHPYTGILPIQRVYKHLSEPLPDIGNLPDDVRDGVNAFIQKATEKNPDERYSNVLEMALAFHEAVGHTHIVHDALYSPSGEFILTASEDRIACLWEAIGQAVQ